MAQDWTASRGSVLRTIWQILALWDGQVVGHGASVTKVRAKKEAAEVTVWDLECIHPLLLTTSTM